MATEGNEAVSHIRVGTTAIAAVGYIWMSGYAA